MTDKGHIPNMRLPFIFAGMVFLLGACAAPPPSSDVKQPKSLPDLVAKIDSSAAKQTFDQVRARLMEEGIRVYFDLHTSELMIRHHFEEHASAYVRWERAKEYKVANEVDEIEVADWLSKVETTRLVLYKEQRKYGLLRLRLSELTGETFSEEMVQPAKPPTEKPPSLSVERLIKATHDAGILPYVHPYVPTVPPYSLNVRSAGVATKARTIEYQVQEVVTGINLAWQGIVTARANLAHSRRNLALQQQLYSQEQSVRLGEAMTQETKSEADLVEATGDYYVNLVKLANMLDMRPESAIEPDFLAKLVKLGYGDSGEQFVPKGGSGFGQDDQNEINK